MKTFIRNFLAILRRFKMATLLNVTGLSVAFAACIVIMVQVTYDLRFDSSLPNASQIYRINLEINGDQIAATPYFIGDGFEASSPYVKAVAITNAMFASVFDQYFTIEDDTRQQIYAEKMMFTSAGYTDVFQPEMIEGSAAVLRQPDHVLIPQSMAERIFKGESAVGKRLRGEDFVCTIGGVYKDFPENSSIHNFILRPLSAEWAGYDWALNYEAYALIDPSQDAEALFATYVTTLDPMIESAGLENLKLFLTPLKTLHFQTSIGFDTVEKTSKTTLWILIVLGLVILVIAVINFTNYSIALTPLRVKSVNTQKVLGAARYTIRNSLMAEAVVISLVSFMLALFLVHWLTFTPLTGLLSGDLTLEMNLPVLFFMGVVALLTGIFASIYPAYYITSFAPAVALRGNFGLSPHGRKLRGSLVSVQFIASFILIVGALCMFMQMKYMQKTDPGYDRSQLIAITTNKQFAEQNELFANELKSYPSIEAVGYSEALLASRDHYDAYQGEFHDAPILFNYIRVDADFLRTIDIPLIEGRHFTKSDLQAEGESFIIFNERARKEYDLQIGDKIDGFLTVVGFIPDIHYSSLRKEIEPMGFALDPTRRFAYVRVKEGTSPYSAMNHVESTLERLSPGYPFDIRLLDEVATSLYTFENNLMVLITLFSVLAILLSLMGIFGLVVYESEYKRKEIGLRKIFGSTTRQILEMLNKRYLSLLSISFLIAAPIAWYAVDLWLQNFAYKTPVYWWVFAITFLLLSTLTSATITFQSWRVANANPVDSIRTE